MNLKKKLKGFFSLRRKANDGFTLVELIVVIAIMAILSGIAVPAYTGYIAKADKAADEQLLSAVNTAFAAACIINGEDNYNRNDVSISLKSVEGGKQVDALTVSGNASIAEAFLQEYYEGGTFKVMESLAYVASVGGFVDNSDGIAQLKQLLHNSSYNGNLGIVTGQVDNLTGALSSYLEENFATLGGSGFAAYLKELGIATDDYDKQSEAAILYLAQNSADMSETDIADAATIMTSLMQTILVGGDQAAVVNQLTEKTGSSLASYAAIYAVAEGIALQQGEGSAAYEALHGENVNLTDAQSVLTAMGTVLGSLGEDDAYELLYGNSNTGSDMTAYFNALQAVNGQQSELETTVKEGGSVVSSTVIQDLITQVGGA